MSKNKKKIVCPHCENEEGEWELYGNARISWYVGNNDEAFNDAGNIQPEEGVDWDNVDFDKSSYQLCCPSCDKLFDIPKDHKLEPSWG